MGDNIRNLESPRSAITRYLIACHDVGFDPGRAKIAEQTKLTVRQVRTQLSRAERYEWLSVVKRGGRRNPTVYMVPECPCVRCRQHRNTLELFDHIDRHVHG